jgi:serine protease Do
MDRKPRYWRPGTPIRPNLFKDTRLHLRRVPIACGLVACLMLVAASAPSPDTVNLPDLKALEAAFVKLAEDVQPSVVSIQTYSVSSVSEDGPFFATIPESKGSGFVIDSDGFIATNDHVVAGAGLISVVLHNGLKYEAKIVKEDERSDLAVLKIDEHHLKPVRWGDIGKTRVGQWAFVCGNPFGLGNMDGRTSFTYGIISALGRQLTDRLVGSQRQRAVRYYGNLIETSAAINPGSSGGPLFNINGEVIGVVTAIETASGVNEGHGYAVPISDNTIRILNTLKRGEQFPYGFLGVNLMDIELDPASARLVRGRVHRGARIDSIVLQDGPAAQAGLRIDDVVVEVDGIPVENVDHLVRLVGFKAPGTQAEIVYERKKVRHKTTVTLGDRWQLLGYERPSQE